MAKDMHSLRLDPSVVVEVDKIATEEGRTRSDVLRRLIVEALHARAAARKRHR